MHRADRVSRPEGITTRALVGSVISIESEMTLLSERKLKCVQKPFDTADIFRAAIYRQQSELFPDAADDRRSAVSRFLMNWVEPEIILDRSQNAVMVVCSRDLLCLDHGTQKYGVDSFRFGISFRLVKSNDHEGALHRIVFRNPCLIVEMKPRGQKHA